MHLARWAIKVLTAKFPNDFAQNEERWHWIEFLGVQLKGSGYSVFRWREKRRTHAAAFAAALSAMRPIFGKRSRSLLNR